MLEPVTVLIVAGALAVGAVTWILVARGNLATARKRIEGELARLASEQGRFATEQARIAEERSRLESDRDGLIDSARLDADNVRRAAELEGREAVQRLREEWAAEADRRRVEVEQLESQAASRNEEAEERFRRLGEHRAQLEEDALRLDGERAELTAKEREIAEAQAKVARQLEEIAGLSREEARRELVSQIRDQAKADAAQHIREARERARSEAEGEARKIVSQAIEKIAANHSSEAAVSVVSLPSNDMKGRIIGREGRNIRAFEATTGVDVVVDDTPGAIILSCFDPVRREVARVAMDRLLADGRIHPARIEEVAERAQREVKRIMRTAAEEALYEVGIHDLHPKLRKVLGVLRFRTSYGQNQLAHAVEVAFIGAAMAAELSLNVALAKRMGLLHDIGKGLTHEKEGSHVELGYDLCKQCGEKDHVLNAIRAHHGDEPARYPETFLVTAADAISGARPGARRESFEHYVKRLEKLEAIASSYPGVEKVYAIRAGREIRIMVIPGQVSDEEMEDLTEKTARRIENELQYPGQIKVVVVRESRAVEFAK